MAWSDAESESSLLARARESEARLVESQRLAKVGDWQWDIATGAIAWSRQTYAIFGRSPLRPPPTYEELGRYYTPAGWSALDAAVRRAAATGEPYELEVEHVRDDGVRGWQLARGEAVRDATGRIVGLRGTAQDITERRRVEEALRDNERRYATMFQRSPLAKAWTKLPEGTLADVNDAWVRLTGVPREEAIGRPSAELGLVAPGDRSRFYEDAIANGSAEADVTLFPRGRGPRVVSSRAELVTLSGDRYLLTAMQDVTDRKRAEEALRESEERARLRASELETVLDAVPAAVWIARDPQGDRIDANRFGAELLRRRAGQNVSLTSPGEDRPRHFVVRRGGRVLGPEELPIQKAARGEESRDTELELAFEDGEVRHMLGSAVPLRDAAGRPVGSVGAFVDITERRRAEARSESLARFPQENPDPVLRLDAALRVLYANRAALTGMAALGLAPEGPAPGPIAAPARRALETRRRLDEERLTCGAVVFSTSFVPVGDEVNVYAHDVTARTHAEDALLEANEKLRQVDRRKTEFLAVLSHELRNPLAPIRNSIFVLERAAPGSEQAARAREVVRRQAEHLTRLVDDLLDVMRVEHGKIVLQRTRIDLREVVRTTTDDLRSVFAQAGVALHVEHVLGPLWVEADATRIAQALGNLLQNAVKFTPRGGLVSVVLRASGASAELCVRDTGVGMDSAMISRLFMPFAQAEQTLARTGGGLGLGLALVKGLVELHGGAVEARSAGAGRGAEFVLRLPLAAAAGATRAPSPDPRRAGARAIVVVEDNVDAADTLADVLRLDGHEVHVAYDGRSGIELARTLRPDVVLCDLGLPDVDGYEVARTLRRDEALAKTRLVALSGYAQPEDVQRAREAGFDAHVAKPPDPDELTGALRPEDGG